MNHRDDQPEKYPPTPATGDTVPAQRVPETTAPSGRAPGRRPADEMLAAGPPPAPPAATDPDRHGPASMTGRGADRAGGARETGRPAGAPLGTAGPPAAGHGTEKTSVAPAARTAPGNPAARTPREHDTTGHAPAAPVTATPLAESPLSAPPPGDPGATGRSEGRTLATPAAPRGQEPAVPTGQAERADLAGRAGHTDHTGHPGTQHGARHDTLLADGERDRLDERLHHALAHFVDAPRSSVEEADAVLDDAGKQLVASLEKRRRALREGWHRDPDAAEQADTEELRQTLRTYREVTQRLLGA